MTSDGTIDAVLKWDEIIIDKVLNKGIKGKYGEISCTKKTEKKCDQSSKKMRIFDILQFRKVNVGPVTHLSISYLGRLIMHMRIFC